MESEESSRISTALASRAGPDASAACIAEASSAIWRDIDAALRPIIGALSVAALFKRSLHLTLAAHPCLAEAQGPIQRSLDVTQLAGVLARQPDAGAVSTALLLAFDQLLASLIGPALTGRLLGPVWENSSGHSLPQDTSS